MRITSIQEEIQKKWPSMAIKQNRIVGFLASLGSKNLLISFLNPNPMELNESKKENSFQQTLFGFCICKQRKGKTIHKYTVI